MLKVNLNGPRKRNSQDNGAAGVLGRVSGMRPAVTDFYLEKILGRNFDKHVMRISASQVEENLLGKNQNCFREMLFKMSMKGFRLKQIDKYENFAILKYVKQDSEKEEWVKFFSGKKEGCMPQLNENVNHNTMLKTINSFSPEDKRFIIEGRALSALRRKEGIEITTPHTVKLARKTAIAAAMLLGMFTIASFAAPLARNFRELYNYSVQQKRSGAYIDGKRQDFSESRKIPRELTERIERKLVQNFNGNVIDWRGRAFVEVRDLKFGTAGRIGEEKEIRLASTIKVAGGIAAFNYIYKNSGVMSAKEYSEMNKLLKQMLSRSSNTASYDLLYMIGKKELERELALSKCKTKPTYLWHKNRSRWMDFLGEYLKSRGIDERPENYMGRFKFYGKGTGGAHVTIEMIELFGMMHVNEVMKAEGLGIEQVEVIPPFGNASVHRNVAEPSELADMMERLYMHSVLDEGMAGKLVELLKRQKYRGQFTELLPHGAEVIFATGWVDQSRVAVGIFPEKQVLLIVHLPADQNKQEEVLASAELIKQIAFEVYSSF